MDSKAKYEEAKAHGYSDSEIAQHLGGKKYQEAIDAGHSDADIIKHFTGINTSPSFKGLLENIGKELGESLTVVKQGAYDIPKSLIMSPVQLAQGKSLGETDLVKDATQIGNAAPAVPGQIANAIEHPLKTAYENPIATASLAFGGAKAIQSLGAKGLKASTGLVGKAGAALESAGAKGQNYAANLRPQTIEAMTRAGQNPGDIGVKVGAKLAQEKLIGATTKETFDNVMNAQKSAGKAVGQAFADINKGNTTVKAETALKPLLDAVKERTGAITSARKAMGKPFEQVYNHFVKQAAGNKGLINLEDIRKAMKEVGPMTHKGSEEVQAAMSELYGTLANVQDHIITKIAETAKNPPIKKSLLAANERYSLLTRIMPDLERAAAKESVGKASFLANPLEATKKFAATKASGFMARTGSALKGFPISETNKGALEATLNRLKGK